MSRVVIGVAACIAVLVAAAGAWWTVGGGRCAVTLGREGAPVPELRGLTLDAARAKSSATHSCFRVVVREDGDPVGAAVVVQQSPEPPGSSTTRDIEVLLGAPDDS